MGKDVKEISKEELIDVAGGSNQVEEFDWNVSTNKKHTSSTWSFSGEANTDGQYFKKVKSEIVEVDDDNNLD